MIKKIAAFLFLFICIQSQAQNLKVIHSGKNTSLRGLSVLNDSVAWISGSRGWTALSLDGGKTWNWKQLKGYENLDFRDIEAFSETKAILVNAGSPAVILLTEDAGNTWKEVYRNNSSNIFLDGMDFWDAENGIIYGDPINQKMVLLKTIDGGHSWKDISDNNKVKLVEGEASFAASGTAIRCDSKGKVWIASGGQRSRLFFSKDYGNTWSFYDCPIIQGKSSTGPFSIAFNGNGIGIAVGGDYLIDLLRINNVLLTKNGGKSWSKPIISTFGYRSAVEYLSNKNLIATGPGGTDFSKDGGKTWFKFSDLGFHTARKAKFGKLVLLTGTDGRIASLSQ